MSKKIFGLLLGFVVLGFSSGVVRAQVVSSVYDDALAPGWTDAWIWYDLTIDHNVTSPVYSGNSSMSFSVGGKQQSAWNGWYNAGFDTSPYLYFRFAARETQPGIPWQVSFLDANGNSLGNTYFNFLPPINTWQVYTLSLSQYGAGYKTISGVRFWHVSTASAANTLYVDAMGFGGNSSQPNLDANTDGTINALDYAVVYGNYGWTGPAGTNISDFNSDGKVDFADVDIMLTAWTK